MRKSFYIQDEMEPMVHPADNQIYTSKSKFRATTKAFGLEECYGEPDSSWEKEKIDREADIAEDVLRSIEMAKYGENLTYEEKTLCEMRDKKILHETE